MMNNFGYQLNSEHVNHMIDLAIREDVGSGDITTALLPNADMSGKGKIIAKEPIVVAGLEIAQQVFEKFEPGVNFLQTCKDGDALNAGDEIAKITCTMRTLLTGERTALNFLQRMSGIATNVRRYVSVLGETNVRLVDTRKTIPGWRILEKYAVRAGGAHNHRMGLFDGVLIKDNHIDALGGIKNAVRHARDSISHLIKIEIEVSNLDEVRQATEAGADVIMLDNMDPDQIKSAVKLIDGKAIIEVSGRVSIDNLKSIADTGIDIISVGALTHTAVSVDISMQIHPSA